MACLILWVGWTMFMPGSDSPFGARTHGLANLYFQAGKYYYLAAPVLVGWCFEVIAVRLRAKAVWLSVGLLLVSWMGSAVRIDANRSTVHRGIGHISMSFGFFSLIPNAYQGMFYARDDSVACRVSVSSLETPQRPNHQLTADSKTQGRQTMLKRILRRAASKVVAVLFLSALIGITGLLGWLSLDHGRMTTLPVLTGSYEVGRVT